MVKIPSLSRRSEPAPAPIRDENGDGRVDARDERPTDPAVADTEPTRTERTRTGSTGTAPVQADRDAAGTTETRSRSAVTERDTAAPPAPPVAPVAPDTDRTTTDRTTETDRTSTVGRTTEPAGTTEADRRVDPAHRPDAERGLGERTPATEDRPDVVVDRGPRPRASMLATLSLVFGVAAAGFVLTGALAGYGIVLGTLALLLGVSGISATARRHVAGKSDALIGIVLGIGAVVVAVLAMTGQFDWPTTDGDTVVRFREWLDSQFVDRF